MKSRQRINLQCAHDVPVPVANIKAAIIYQIILGIISPGFCTDYEQQPIYYFLTVGRVLSIS